MGTKAVRLAACALAVSFLGSPPGLSAEERRGAAVVVTRSGGQIAEGELIAVKPDSLLLLSAGTDLSVPLAEIEAVRIVRKSQARKFALIGGVAGFVGMGAFVLAVAQEDVVDDKAGAALLLGLLAGATGALAGSLAGSALGVDSTFAFTGKPEAAIAEYLNGLQAYSRLGRPPEAKAAPRQEPVPKPQTAEPAAPPAQPAKARKPRFRIHVAGQYLDTEPVFFQEDGSFGFPDEVPPEAGPYAAPVTGDSFSVASPFDVTSPNHMTFGPVTLAYDWHEHWSAELEGLFLYTYVSPMAELTFTSTVDGRTYWSDVYTQNRAGIGAVMFGVSYRPLVPSAFRRHALEAGIAAGPAFVSGQANPELLFSSPSYRKVVPCGRIKAAYDFYISQAFSAGAFAGYLFLEAEQPAFSSSGSVTFMPTTEAEPLVRATEITIPALPIKASGVFFGFRVGFRI